MKKWILVCGVSTMGLVSLTRPGLAYEGGKTQPHTHQSLNSGGNSLFLTQVTVSTLTVTSSTTFKGPITITRNLDNDGSIIIDNQNPGTLAESIASFTNNGLFNGLDVGVTGLGYTTQGTFLKNQGYISAGTDITNGLNIVARAVGSSITFATNGHTNLRTTIDSNGLFIHESSMTLKGSLLVNGGPSVFKSSVSSLGVADGSTAPAGYVGEIMTNTLTGSAAIPASGNYLAVSTLSLTSGDWLVTGSFEFTAGGTTASTIIAGTINTSATDNNTPGCIVQDAHTAIASASDIFLIGPCRVNISSPTTIRLYVTSVYTVLGGAFWSSVSTGLNAVRVR